MSGGPPRPLPTPVLRPDRRWLQIRWGIYRVRRWLRARRR